MPVNSSHAYAKGTVFRYKKSILRPLIRIFFNWLEMQRSQLVWDAFKKNSMMGRDCYLGPNAWCVNYGEPENIMLGNRVYCRGLLRCGTRGSGSISIGDGVYIGDDCIISSECRVEIGNLTMISHGVHIFDSIGHPIDPLLRERDWRIILGDIQEPRPEVAKSPVLIGQRVWIGFNSVIMRGVTIGDGAIVGAGSVVVDDVPPNTIVVGNPAQIKKNV